MHEYSRKLSLTKDPLTMTHLATSIDGMFCRKRGRPPKNRVIEVWNDYVWDFVFSISSFSVSYTEYLRYNLITIQSRADYNVRFYKFQTHIGLILESAHD